MPAKAYNGPRYTFEEWVERFGRPGGPTFDNAGRVLGVGGWFFPTEPCYCERAPEDEGQPFPNVRPRSRGFHRGAA